MNYTSSGHLEEIRILEDGLYDAHEISLASKIEYTTVTDNLVGIVYCKHLDGTKPQTVSAYVRKSNAEHCLLEMMMAKK